MKKEKILFVYNPCAGKGTLRNKLADIVDLMMENDFDVTIAATHTDYITTTYILVC